MAPAVRQVSPERVFPLGELCWGQ